eukprot:5759848-Amphidinium_carterae.2
MLQRSYIKHHPTSGYKTATPEMKRVYDGFEVYNYHEKNNPRKPIDMKDDDYRPMGLTQLLGISLHYAPNFFNTMKTQRLDNLRQQAWEEDRVRQHEHVLQNTKLLKLYIVLPEKAMDMWLQLGKLPASYMENATDNRHGYYSFHTEVQYAINDHMNLYLYNYPENFSQKSIQFTGQNHYFTVDDLKGTNRQTHWYTRKDMDRQFQIKGEQIGREGQLMEDTSH